MQILLLSVALSLFSLIRFSEKKVEITGEAPLEMKKAIANHNQKFFSPVIEKLKKIKVDSVFIENILSDPKLKFSEKLVLINVSGFIKKADYTQSVSWNSARQARQFMKDNISIFEYAETKYSVPKETIASIIWIETRAGSFLGNNHLPSVFFSAAMADQQSFIESSKKRAYDLAEESGQDTLGLGEKIESRAKSKAKWALDEIIALAEMAKKSPYKIELLNGSWAGAFGLPQFLPSSYLKFALDGSGDGKIDLFLPEDAIISVANYLRANGWGYTNESKRKAVFSYNRSDDYVNAVLTLASRI